MHPQNRSACKCKKSPYPCGQGNEYGLCVLCALITRLIHIQIYVLLVSNLKKKKKWSAKKTFSSALEYLISQIPWSSSFSSRSLSSLAVITSNHLSPSRHLRSCSNLDSFVANDNPPTSYQHTQVSLPLSSSFSDCQIYCKFLYLHSSSLPL